jgi:hypothetical protein
VLPTLNLDFANSQSLDKRITFSRGSIGTRVNRNGLIETIPANQPRFDFDPISGECRGLLIEESRTNLITSSNGFDDASWGKTNSSVTSNSTTSPDGSSNAYLLLENSIRGQRWLNKNTSGITASSNITASVYVKFYSLNRRFSLQLTDAPSGGSNYSDVSIRSSGQINIASSNFTNTTASVSSLSNGWYRVSLSITTSTVTTLTVRLILTDNTGSQSYGGDGTSGIYVWGAQLEAGSFPTSYIPTTASTVTRSADNADMTGTNFSSWYNSSEGSLFVASRVNALGSSGYPGIAYVDDGTVNNCMGFYVDDAGSDRIGAESYLSGRAQYTLFSSSATTANKLNKAISSYSINNFSAAFDTSSQIQRDTSGSIPTVNRLRIGALRGGVYPLNGTISRLTYYPKALSPAEIQYLTQ